MKPTRRKPYPAALASRKMLEAQGWVVATVEQSMAFGKVRFKRDCFSFGDLLAISPTKGIMMVQATADKSTSHFHNRVAKIRATAEAGLWLAAGGRIQVMSWESSEPPLEFKMEIAVSGEKERLFRGRWCRVLEITTDD